MTNQMAHTDQTEWPARMAIIEARADALTVLWGEHAAIYADGMRTESDLAVGLRAA